jgi:hypothetical protein
MADSNNYQVVQNGANWSIIDVASGTSIVTFANQDVATQLATSGDFSAANIEKSMFQDINYQSGVQTQVDTTTSNTTGTPTTSGDPAIAGSQVVDEAGTVSQFQRNEYGDWASRPIARSGRCARERQFHAWKRTVESDRDDLW